jgi:outer membrane protein assembly factor BamD (BamD/ComL family)
MRLRNVPPAALALVLALGARPAPVHGQEVFELSDADDTWVGETTIDPATPEGQLALARRALAAGDGQRAEFLATRWIDRYPQHPSMAQALLVRGDARRARRDYYKALFDYETIARQHPGSDVFITALERELEIAKMFATGTRRRLWGMRIIDASDEAEELLIRVQERLPGSRLAEQAGLALGDFYFTRRKMTLAAEMYSLFIENFPRSEHVGKARKRLIYAHLASFKGPEFDAGGLYEARTRLRQLKAVDPLVAQQMGADALLLRIDESIARKMFTTAQWYQSTGDVIAAELTIRHLVERYPRTVATVDALRLAPAIVARLPESIVAEAPDYEALRAMILGAPTVPVPAAPELDLEDLP